MELNPYIIHDSQVAIERVNEAVNRRDADALLPILCNNPYLLKKEACKRAIHFLVEVNFPIVWYLTMNFKTHMQPLFYDWIMEAGTATLNQEAVQFALSNGAKPIVAPAQSRLQRCR